MAKRRLRIADSTKRDKAHQETVVIRDKKRRVNLELILVPLKFVGRIIIPKYLRTSWHELRQVTWPSHKQTRQLTTAVVLFALVFGVIVAIFDYGLDKLFKEVLK